VTELVKDTFNMKMMSLDVALKHTGVAIYNVRTSDYAHQLKHVDLIKTDEDDPVDMRVRRVLLEVSKLWHDWQVNCVLIEKPATAIYGVGPFTKASYIMGRAMAIAKVNSSAFGCVGMCFATNMYHRVVEPKQWQPDLAKGESKRWSIKQANNVISYLKFNHRKLLMAGDEDHNIADAINIGRAAIIKYAKKEWEPPALAEAA